eukprot:10662866-Karenia_brevis.AAC.1
MPRQVYDLKGILPDTALTEVPWPKFLRALIYLMPEDAIEDMWQYASKSSHKNAYYAARKVQDENKLNKTARVH